MGHSLPIRARGIARPVCICFKISGFGLRRSTLPFAIKFRSSELLVPNRESPSVGRSVGSYARRRVDKQGSAHRTTPDNGVIYKSGYFTVTAQNFKSLFPNFTDPLTSRSPNSSDKSVGCRLHCSRDEGSFGVSHGHVGIAGLFQKEGVDVAIANLWLHDNGRGEGLQHWIPER